MRTGVFASSLIAVLAMSALSGCGSTSQPAQELNGKVVKSEKVAMTCRSDERKSVRMQAVTGGVISNADGVDHGRNIEGLKGTSVGKGTYHDVSGDIAESYFACESKGYLTTVTFSHPLSGLQEHKVINTDRQLVIGSTVVFVY